MLKAAGLPELVTASLEDYEALALKLATDPALLPSIRRKLADNRPTCPLFDSDRFRRHIEAAYTTMWDIYRRGESPRSFASSRERFRTGGIRFSAGHATTAEARTGRRDVAPAVPAEFVV